MLSRGDEGRRSRLVVLRAVLAGFVLTLVLGGTAWSQKESPPPSPPPEKGDEIQVPPSSPPPESEPPLPAPGSAVLSAVPLTGTVPLAVTFDGSSSNRVISYRLAFGDGETTEGKGTPGTFTHTYADPSAYTAVLTVFSSDEQTYTDSVTIDATEPTPTTTAPTEDTTRAPRNRDRETPRQQLPGPGPDDDDPATPLDADPLSAELPGENAERSVFVRSVRDVTELSLSPRLILESILLAGVLILLIGFPAEMFNATLLENYEEISGWFSWSWVERFRTWMSGLHPAKVAVAFAGLGALIHSQLEPHFSLDKGGLALIVGLFFTFLVISLTYDVMRRGHLRKRHKLSSDLRAQMLGMFVAAILVFASRIGHFHPGYMYGLFTALAYAGVIHERHHGRALAIASVRLFVVAIVAWFAWIPVKHMAEEPDASFLILTLDAMLAVLWVAGLAAIVFGLAPLRFFYGETVKAWSFKGWLALWVPGVVMFVYTLLHPERGLYGSSDEASLASVLLLFVGFGLFSLAFWGFFKVRGVRKSPAAETLTDSKA